MIPTSRKAPRCTCPLAGTWGATGALPAGHVIANHGSHYYLAHTPEYEQEINMGASHTTEDLSAAAKPRRYRVTTGELRGKLQPVVFLRLNETIEGLNANLVANTLVSVQFWGPGAAVVNSVNGGPAVTVDDRTIRGRWPDADAGSEVITAELRARLQPVVFGRLVETVRDNSDGSTLEAGEQVAIQFWGGGMTALTNIRTGEQVVARTNTIHVDWDPFDLP